MRTNLKREMERAQREFLLLREALTELAAGRVRWSEPKLTTRITGMGAEMTRVGLTGRDVLIVHDVDSDRVAAYTGDQAADWCWQFVSQYPGLGAWLAAHVDTEAPVSVHTPTEAWIRRVQRVGQSAVVVVAAEGRS